MSDSAVAGFLAERFVMSFSPGYAQSIALLRKRLPSAVLQGIRELDCATVAQFITAHVGTWHAPSGDWFGSMLERVRDAVEREDAKSLKGAAHKIETGKQNYAAVEAQSQSTNARVRKGQAVLDIAGKLELDESTVRRHRRALTKNQKIPNQ